jgi:hypothetical protein
MSLRDLDALLAQLHTLDDQDANSEFSVLLVDRSVDGVQFVSDYLAASDTRFDTIHLVTHGFVGGLQLGNVELTASNLNLYANQFDVWRSSLSEDAELFLYGCSIASGSTGTEFVNQLSNRLNVDTAASLDWTGAVALGGDWTLEYTQGSVDMSSGLGYLVELDWQFILSSNNAPVLDDSASPTLGSVLEGATNLSGVTVASLVVDGSITDPDGSAVEAIAITALNTSLGTWQYSLNGGGSWLDVDTASINSTANELALLLGPTAQLRLVPTGDLNGSLSNALTFRAWDMSTGSEGQYVVITSTGGGTAFSSASDMATITVTPVNDAPTFSDTLGGTVSFTEGGSAVVLDSNVQVFDAENSISNFSGSTLTLTSGGGANSQDLFSATGTLGVLTQGSSLTVGGITIGTVTTNSGGTLVLTFNSSATNALVNSAMQQIAYANSSVAPPASVQIDWTFRTAAKAQFTDVTATAGVGDAGNAFDGTWGDYDGDGHLDLYIVNAGANILYRNNGNGTFTNVTAAAGVGYVGSGGAGEWGDADSDGDLDLYLANGYTQLDVLYRNDGNGTFTNITVSAGIGDDRHGMASEWADYDGDGDLDLYITNYGTANILYRNDTITSAVTLTTTGQVIVNITSVNYAPVLSTPPSSGLVGWWKMDESSGASTADASGTGIAEH